MRLDAIARWLQDIAYRDVEDAGLADSAVWVLRRTRINALRFPQFDELCKVTTWCSGIGKMWAERRTTVALATDPGRDGVESSSTDAASEVLVEAVAVWVHIDPERLMPFQITEQELAVFGASIGGREIQARLKHPKPPEDAIGYDWNFRYTDVDLADHVNNAAYWETIEEQLVATGEVEPEMLDVELEHRSPAQPGPHLLLRGEHYGWLTTPDRSEVLSSAAFLARG
jgi:acyl-ACP thioesterase